jgi:hypothetical protein
LISAYLDSRCDELDDRIQVGISGTEADGPDEVGFHLISVSSDEMGMDCNEAEKRVNVQSRCGKPKVRGRKATSAR